MAELLAKKNSGLKKSEIPAAAAEPEAPKDGLMAELAKKGAGGLRKTNFEPRASVSQGDPLMEEIRLKAASRAESSRAALDATDQLTVHQPPPQNVPNDQMNPLAAEILQSSLKPNESKFKVPDPPAPVHAAPTKLPGVSKPSAASAAPAVDLPADGSRPLAPTIDEDGKPIPKWKQKVVQKRLDAEYAKVAAAKQEIAAREARWVGVPAWKRAMMEKKEADALRGDAGEPDPAPAPPPQPKEPAAKATPFGAGLKQTGLRSVGEVKPANKYAPPPVAAPPPSDPAPRFDPMTGKPLAPPAPAAARFDPMTGKPLAVAVAPAAGRAPAYTPPASVAPAAPKFQAPPKANAYAPQPPAPAEPADDTPMQAWKAKLVDKKRQEKDKEIDRLREEKAAHEARWIGVPAWKRAIIEKKEAADKGL